MARFIKTQIQDGWMEEYVFKAWISQIFIPFVRPMKKLVVLFFDGHESHQIFDSERRRRGRPHRVHSAPRLIPFNRWMLGLVCRAYSLVKMWRNILQKSYWEWIETCEKKYHFPVLLSKLFRNEAASRLYNEWVCTKHERSGHFRIQNRLLQDDGNSGR